ncbi:MAG: hypothetical protein WDM78_05065 [Puia sp.]
MGVGNNDYDYDVWGPQFRGQPIPQYDGAYDPTKNLQRLMQMVVLIRGMWRQHPGWHAEKIT